MLLSRPRGAWLRAALALGAHSAPAWQSLADWSATAHFPCSRLRPQDESVLSPCLDKRVRPCMYAPAWSPSCGRCFERSGIDAAAFLGFSAGRPSEGLPPAQDAAAASAALAAYCRSLQATAELAAFVRLCASRVTQRHTKQQPHVHAGRLCRLAAAMQRQPRPSAACCAPCSCFQLPPRTRQTHWTLQGWTTTWTLCRPRPGSASRRSCLQCWQVCAVTQLVFCNCIRERDVIVHAMPARRGCFVARTAEPLAQTSGCYQFLLVSSAEAAERTIVCRPGAACCKPSVRCSDHLTSGQSTPSQYTLLWALHVPSAETNPAAFCLPGEGLGKDVHRRVLALLTRLSAVAPSETLFAALVEQRRAEEGASSGG